MCLSFIKLIDMIKKLVFQNKAQINQLMIWRNTYIIELFINNEYFFKHFLEMTFRCHVLCKWTVFF